MHEEHRRKHNEEFLRRLIARRPDLAAKYEPVLRANSTEELPEVALEGLDRVVRPAPRVALESTDGLDLVVPPAPPALDIVLETIVNNQRPILFVADDRLDTNQVTIKGEEARVLVDVMADADEWLREYMPLVGRIDVANFPGEYVGTGWFVAEDIVVTNRHVASQIARWDGRRFAFNQGVAGRQITASVCTTHELDDEAIDPQRLFEVSEVLYIEPDKAPHDIAFVRVKRTPRDNERRFIPVANTDVGPEQLVCAIGYPARASRRVIPDQELMNELYRGRFDVKRAAPGYTMSTAQGVSRHDCTTLGGNSGSVVFNLKTRQAVGLHFAGLYQETNYAVRASVLTEYINRKRWNEPFVIEPRTVQPQAENTVVAQSTGTPTADGAVSVTVPVTITVRLGAPVSGAAAAATAATDPEEAARAFWSARPAGVIAARVGFLEDGKTIGDTPCIAASVPPERLADVEAAGPKEFAGVPVIYIPAEAAEQLETLVSLEGVGRIAYDDDARTADEFSFDTVNQPMDLLLHVGPEYSWETLQKFLGDAERELVSAIYEFHAVSVKDALAERLDNGVTFQLVADNTTFIEVEKPDEQFDARDVFGEWEEAYGDRFRRIVAPEGGTGLVANSYHMKVTVRDEDTFWLSSGNWKMSSSQPPITEEDRRNAEGSDLPGNREWHIVVKNKTLAERLRAHILQDFARSHDLGGGPVPRTKEEREEFILVPVEEAVAVEERRAPNRFLPPKEISGKRKKVQLLLTPDFEGEIYSDAVLNLINSARESLWFQIPYIAMPSKPGENRGYIDELLAALTSKLKTLPDARVLLRSMGKQFSSPTHAAWYFKSKGVDINARLRAIDDHHTKGMIVDGKRVLIGSHNWSQLGVTLNRDASLLFHDAEVARYYADAFEIDWERANPIRPKKFVRPAPVREGTADAAPAGFRRVAIRELLHDE